MDDYALVWMVLAFYGPFWLFLSVVVGLAVTLRHRRLREMQGAATALVDAMLARNMSSDEIERILIAWCRDRKAAAMFQRNQLAKKKSVTSPHHPYTS